MTPVLDHALPTDYHQSDLGKLITAILQDFRRTVDTSPKLSDAAYVTQLKQTLSQLVLLSTQIALPANGHTLQRWQVLAQVAACDLNLVKFFESADFKSAVSTDFTTRARTSNELALYKSRQTKF